jgi:hypothetical protein
VVNGDGEDKGQMRVVGHREDKEEKQETVAGDEDGTSL